jgi:cytochrome c1
MRDWTFKTAALLAAALCSGAALHAQAETGNYSSGEQGAIRRTAPSKPATGASYDAGAYPSFRPPLAAGEGARELNNYCNRCHSPRYIVMQPVLPAGTWSDEVNKMIKTYGAPVPDDAAQKIIAYLQSHYTPETRKH